LKNARKIGIVGEAAAADFLKKIGYNILANNYVARGGEIDLIALDPCFCGEQCLVFAEVKSRQNTLSGFAVDSVTVSKIKKITAATNDYLIKNNLLDAFVRFDIIEVYDNKDINHIINAFDAID